MKRAVCTNGDTLWKATSITLEQARKDYLSGKSEYWYAIVNVRSGLPWQLSKERLSDEHIQHLQDKDFFCYGVLRTFKQVDLAEVWI